MIREGVSAVAVIARTNKKGTKPELCASCLSSLFKFRMFILTRISRIDTKPCGRYSYYSKPWTATNFTNHPDGISAIRSTEGALCNKFSLHSFVKICVIRVEMNKLNTSES